VLDCSVVDYCNACETGADFSACAIIIQLICEPNVNYSFEIRFSQPSSLVELEELRWLMDRGERERSCNRIVK